MSLLDQYSEPPRAESREFEQPGLTELFAKSASYELHQSVYGLAQTVALEGLVGKMEPPQQADGAVEKLAQMLGRGVGDFLPTLAVAAGVRFGFGRVLPLAAGAESLILKRSAIGLSVAESATTGTITGALFKPSDQATASDWRSFAADRALGGGAGAVSFAALTLGTLGWSRLAGHSWVERLGADRVLKSSFVSGLASGVAGGLANVEINSLLSDGKVTIDGATIGKAMGEMAIMGGLFGATTSGLALLSRAGRASLPASPLDARDRLDLERQETSLNSLFGAESPTVTRLETVLGASHQATLPDLAKFIEQSPQTRVPLIEKLVDAGAEKLPVGAGNLKGYLQLSGQLEGDEQLRIELFSRLTGRSNPADLAEFLAEAPQNQAFLKTALALGIDDSGLAQLPALQSISQYIDSEPSLMAQLIKLGREKLNFNALDHNIGNFPQEGTRSLKDLLAMRPQPHWESSEAVNQALNSLRLSRYFPEGADPMPSVRNYSSWRQSDVTRVLCNFMDGERIGRPEIVRQLMHSDWDGYSVTKEHLETLERLYKHFGSEKNAFADLLSHFEERNAHALTAVATFLEEDPQTNKAVVETILQYPKPVFSAPQYSRLKALAALNLEFGADSPAVTRLLEREGTAPMLLKSVADFIGHDAARKLMVQQLLDLDTPVGFLTEPQLVGRWRLNAHFGSDSTVMQKLSGYDPGSLNLDYLAKFVDGGFMERKQAPLAIGEPSLAERKALLQELIDDGTAAGALAGLRLQSLAELRVAFGRDSEVLRLILAGEKGYGYSLNELTEFMESNTGRAFVEQALEAPKPTADGAEREFDWSPSRWRALVALEQELKPDPAMAKRLVDMVGAGVRPDHLVAFINGDISQTAPRFAASHESEKLPLDQDIEEGAGEKTNGAAPELAKLRRARLVRQELENEATLVPVRLDPYRLASVEYLDALFQRNPEVMPHLLALENQGLDLSALLQFIKRYDGTSSICARADLVAQIVARGASSGELEGGRLEGLFWAQEKFAGDARALELLRAKEKEGLSFSALAKVLLSYGENMNWLPLEQIIRTMVEEQRPVEQFAEKPLLRKAILDNLIPEHSPARIKLAELFNNEAVDAEELWSLVRGRPQRIATLVRMSNDGASAEDLSHLNMLGFLGLYDKFDSEPSLINRLYELRKHGLNIYDTDKFLNDDANNLLFLRELIERGYEAKPVDAAKLAKQLDVANLQDILALRSVAQRLAPSSNGQSYLESLQEQGLSGSRLAEFIAERPERIETVEQLIRANSDKDRFNDQMRLGVFPENAASQLADSARAGGMSVARVLGNLRDWSSGAAFRDLVIEQVESGKPTTNTALEELAGQARAHPERKLGATKDGAGHKNGSDQAIALAATLTKTADRIQELFAPEQTFVLLGRDAWPLLPVLRARGVDAQYFLWSRLNENDPNTLKQWLKEVPPGAVVIDSGFRGSVLDNIRKGDPTASGYLISAFSSSKYDYLLKEPDHLDQVARLEDLAKYTSRSLTFTPRGGAVVVDERHPEFERERVMQKRARFDELSRWKAESEIREVLRATGLSPWQVWRYSQFVGLTPAERLGVSGGEQLYAHYERVERLRRFRALSAEAKGL